MCTMWYWKPNEGALQERKAVLLSSPSTFASLCPCFFYNLSLCKVGPVCLTKLLFDGSCTGCCSGLEGAFSKGPHCAESGLEPAEAALATAIFRAVQNPDGAFQRAPARPDLFPAGGWLWPLEEARESRSCSRKGCCLRRFHGKKKTEKRQMGSIGQETTAHVQLKYQIRK